MTQPDKALSLDFIQEGPPAAILLDLIAAGEPRCYVFSNQWECKQ
jgi:hypothetical protein